MSAVRDDACQLVLGDLAALAMQVQNPVAPFPLLYSNSDCGGGITNGAFPQYFFNSICPAGIVPNVEDNCLRIITDYDGTFDPFQPKKLSGDQVNVLPGGTDEKGMSRPDWNGNIFTNSTSRLFSWFFPENFYVIFYRGNPMTMTAAAAAAQGYLKVDPNNVEPNSCLTNPTLSNGLPFFSGVGDDCREAYCGACSGRSGNIPPSDICKNGGTYQSCPAVNHNAPYFIIVQTGDFADNIIDMCVNNGIHTVGRNSLNRVWKPQSAGCDQYITSLCNISNLSDSPYKETCSCFTQQQNLNNEYTAALGVPVCCFGFDDSTTPTDITKSCAFNMKAYKTAFMDANCCSPAICQTVLDNNTQIKVKTSPPGQIYCAGTFVEYPVVPVPVPNASSILIDISSSIPFYTWIVLIVGVVLLLLFVLALAFV